ncbi:MAG: cytidylate kinase-like family protein [Dehalococcoidia bacterium]|nr:cytidylate kinase-like family protein [Dehalococcoidia bacterium]
MPVVTVEGPIGAGAPEVGVIVSKLLDADYVDRAILADAARTMGTTVQVLEIKHGRIPLRARIAQFLQTMLERSAMSSGAGEPYAFYNVDYVLGEDYTDLAQEPLTAAQRLNDEHFIEATGSVIRDLAAGGNVVIIGRGSTMFLKDFPGVLHVGLVAPLEARIRNIEEREHLTRLEAEEHADNTERARIAYFRKFFKVDPNDPTLYHIVLNMAHVGADTLAEIIAHSATDLARADVVSQA